MAVFFGDHINHSWKRIVSHSRSCLSSPLPAAIVFANKEEGFLAKKQINKIIHEGEEEEEFWIVAGQVH